MSLLDVRPEERKTAALAFTTLLGITASHTLVETARDALFLARVPVTQLPVLYLVIAGVGLLMQRLGRTLEARGRRPGSVAAPMFGASAITGLFWVASAMPGRPLLYLLYVYSGVFASWVAGRLWLRLADVLTFAQAKRLFALVGTGGVLGAVVGAASARLALTVFPVRHLLLGGAVLLLATALGPASMLPAPAAPERKPRPEVVPTGTMAEVTGDPYVLRVLGIVMLAAAAGTAIDFLFKSDVIRTRAPGQIAPYLATVALVTNGAALVAQAVGVGFAMRSLGVHRALYVMPTLVGAGALAATVGVTGAPAGLRGIDGTLRHSLHKTGTELLFVPLPDGKRARVKPIVELVGQRGGQAVMSVALLGLGSWGSPHLVAGVIGVLAIAWVVVAYGTRRRYLDVFRVALAEGRVDVPRELPELDMTTLEVLIGALSSRKDAEVLGALDLLAAQQRGRLVPTLILFHPSKVVVLRALELLVREGRTELVAVADRLLSHPDVEIATAALRARLAVAFEPAFVRERLDDAREELRATALTALVAGGELSVAEATTALDGFVTGPAEVRRALARAIGDATRETATPLDAASVLLAALERLAVDPDVETRSLATAAMGGARTPHVLPALFARLKDGRPGIVATEALAALGDVSVEFVDRALDADDASPEVKWRLVRALAGSPSPRASERLVARLATSTEPAMSGRLLRALLSVRTRGGAVRCDAEVLVRHGLGAADGFATALAFGLAHRDLVAKTPGLASPTADLLQKLTCDQRAECVERLFGALALLHPEERFARILRGLASKSARARATSTELLENVLRAPLRDVTLTVVADMADDRKLAKVGRPRPETHYAELLRAMVEHGGELGALALYRARELGIETSVRDVDAVADFGDAGVLGEALSGTLQDRGSSGRLP